MCIDRLKHLIADCPSGIDAPEEIRHILETAPQVLKNAENALQSNDPILFEQLHEALERTEVFVTWATATIKGQGTAQAIKNGREADPLLPVEDRLLNRILKFSLTKVDGPTYLQLVKEFAGDDAVSGNTVYMDPTGETEAFSQWLVHDICLPGQQKRLIDIFAEKHSAELPDDEKALLRLRQADHPSIYKVIDLSGDHEAPGIYLIQDLLSPNDSLRIWDISSSKTLTRGPLFWAGRFLMTKNPICTAFWARLRNCLKNYGPFCCHISINGKCNILEAIRAQRLLRSTGPVMPA